MRPILLPVAVTFALGLASASAVTREVAAKETARQDPDAPVVTYPGFRMLSDGASFVWIEADRPITVTTTKTDRRVVYHLLGAITLSRNNTRPLITEYFPSPVRRAQLVKSPDGLDLVIDLRQEAEATQRLTTTDRGVSLRVDFPALK